RPRVARHRGLRDADGHAGRRRLPVAGVQQPRLLAHHPECHHHRRHRVPARPSHGADRGTHEGGVMPYLDVCAVEKSFVTPRGLTHVLGGVSLSLEDGEFVAIVGYSGSGKTTLIALIAGLLAPDAGTIVLDGEAVREPGPERGIVFQQYSLLPWMTARENIALAVEAVDGALPKAERHRRIDELVALVGLSAAAARPPGAVLGPPLEVGLPRPRQRRHMSLAPAYQKVRQGIVEFLRACRRGA